MSFCNPLQAGSAGSQTMMWNKQNQSTKESPLVVLSLFWLFWFFLLRGPQHCHWKTRATSHRKKNMRHFVSITPHPFTCPTSPNTSPLPRSCSLISASFYVFFVMLKQQGGKFFPSISTSQLNILVLSDSLDISYGRLKDPLMSNSEGAVQTFVLSMPLHVLGEVSKSLGDYRQREDIGMGWGQNQK